MDIRRIMTIMDASHLTRRTIENSLREIDRRALNAMVLVKRHGNTLASYGVIARAFRDHAVLLKEAAAPLQQSIAPLVRVHMRILQNRQFSRMFQLAEDAARGRAPAMAFLSNSAANGQRNPAADEQEGLAILHQLIQTVIRLQEGIAEQEYVVTNGRIEAALSERSGAPLMRVSHEMGLAVAKVRNAIWNYRGKLEEVLHESRTGV